MSIVLDGTSGITTPNVNSTTSTLGPLTQALNLGSTGQIVFPATQNPSANANTLDDYEEGTWTPADISGAGLTFSNTSGTCFYTKTGNIVVASFRLTYPSTSNATSVAIGGLPFTSNNMPTSNNSVCFSEQNYSAGLMGVVITNSTFFVLLTTNGSIVTVPTNANLSGKDLRGTIIYRATA